MLEVEINFPISDFERALKWFGLAFKDKKPTNEDQRLYAKFGMLIESLRMDEIAEKNES